MIKIPFIMPGYTYTKSVSYAAFAASLPPVGCTLHDLGVCSDGVNHVYGLSLGTLDGSKPIIYIEGTIHGAHEWRCAHWVKKFMERLASPSNVPAAASLLKRLTRKFSFYAIPCLNPYGYENNAYVNANGVNLNRNFDAGWTDYPTTEPFDDQYKGTAAFSEPETLMVKSVVETYSPLLTVDCHTWGGYNGGSIEIETAGAKYAMLGRDISRSIGLTLARADMSYTQYLTAAPRVGEWTGRKLTARTGFPICHVTFEPGSLETELEQSRIGQNGLLLICLYYMNYMQTKEMVKH
jgi:hypothetical protein